MQQQQQPPLPKASGKAWQGRETTGAPSSHWHPAQPRRMGARKPSEGGRGRGQCGAPPTAHSVARQGQELPPRTEFPGHDASGDRKGATSLHGVLEPCTVTRLKPTNRQAKGHRATGTQGEASPGRKLHTTHRAGKGDPMGGGDSWLAPAPRVRREGQLLGRGRPKHKGVRCGRGPTAPPLVPPATPPPVSQGRKTSLAATCCIMRTPEKPRWISPPSPGLPPAASAPWHRAQPPFPCPLTKGRKEINFSNTCL